MLLCGDMFFSVLLFRAKQRYNLPELENQKETKTFEQKKCFLSQKN